MQSLNISEHFQLLKLLGEGTYGKVMLAVHKKRGSSIFYPLHIWLFLFFICNEQNTDCCNGAYLGVVIWKRA